MGAVQREVGSKCLQHPTYVLFVNNDILLDPESRLRQSLPSVSYCSPSVQSYFATNIIYVPPRRPFKTINPGNKLHEENGPESDEFIKVYSISPTSQVLAHKTQSETFSERHGNEQANTKKAHTWNNLLVTAHKMYLKVTWSTGAASLIPLAVPSVSLTRLATISQCCVSPGFISKQMTDTAVFILSRHVDFFLSYRYVPRALFFLP